MEDGIRGACHAAKDGEMSRQDVKAARQVECIFILTCMACPVSHRS